MKRFFAWLAVVVLPLLAGIASFFAAALATSRVGGLVGVSLAVCFISASALALLVARPLARATAIGAAVTAVLTLLGWGVLFRRDAPVVPPMQTRAHQFARWTLPTGTIAPVLQLGAANPGVPVVYLHGGPGAYVLNEDVDFFTALAERGHRVVLYDQVGGGESPPLPWREYSIARDVADLDAIRTKLGVERITLLGHSWGARLAYEYALTHPNNVERLVLAAPGPLDPEDNDFRLERTAARDRGPPSILPYLPAAILLGKLNPEAAFAFATREELAHAAADGAIDVASYMCHGAPIPEFPRGGLDVVHLMMLRWELWDVRPPPPPRIPKTLIVRGACEVVTWSAAARYRERLNASLVSLPGVGHLLWQIRGPDLVALVDAFLRDALLPQPVYTGAEEPPL